MKDIKRYEEHIEYQCSRFLKARCFAIPFMLLSFQIINFMQAADHGKISFLMSIIRHLLLNIPIMIIFDAIWGIDGLIWSQTVSDILNTAVSYILYFKVHKKIAASQDKEINDYETV